MPDASRWRQRQCRPHLRNRLRRVSSDRVLMSRPLRQASANSSSSRTATHSNSASARCSAATKPSAAAGVRAAIVSFEASCRQAAIAAAFEETAQQAQHTVANMLGGLLSISSRDGVPKLADRELGKLWASSLN